MYINRKTGELVEAKFGRNIDKWEVEISLTESIYLSNADFQEQYGEAMICPVDKRDCGLLCKGEHCGIHSKLIDCGITCEDKKYPCIPYIPKEYDVDKEELINCGTCNAQKEQMKKLDPLPRFDKVFEEGYANMCEEEQTSQIIARATKEVEELISIGEKMTGQKEQKPVFVENMPTVNTPPLSTQSNSQEKPDSLLLSDEEIRNIFDRAIDVLIDSGIVLDDIMPEIKDCIKAELKHLEKLGIVYVKVPDYFCNKDNIRYFKVCDLHFEADPTGEYCINCPNLGKGVKHILISEYRKENEK